MNASKLLRKQLGLSQADFASHLGVPKSAVSMYETGKRDLPARAWKKYSELQAALNTKDSGKKKTPVQTSVEQTEFQKALKRNLADAKHELNRQERILQEKQNLYETSIHRIDKLMTARNAGSKKSKSDQEWWNIHHINATKKMKSCNLTVRNMIVVRIAGLKAEILTMEGMIGK